MVEPQEVLSNDALERFVTDGFVHLRCAFSPDLAAAGRAILWSDMGLDSASPSTWQEPAIRLVPSVDAPFREAVNTARLRGACDQLIGAGRWHSRPNSGTFVVRFPSVQQPDDTGWHIEGSFAVDGVYRVNLRSRDRELLLLMLFSDVTDRDGPTRIRVGSHLDVPAPLGAALATSAATGSSEG